MPNWYWIIAAVSLGLPILFRLVVKWIVAPIILHRKQRTSLRPSFEYATPEHFTPELSQMLQTVLPQFREEGFEAAATIHLPDSIPGVRALQVMLVNRSTQDIAVIIGTWSRSIRSLVFAVRSEFADDTAVVTGVNRGVGVFPPDPAVNSDGFTRLSDIRALCEFHRRRLRHLGLEQRPRTAPAPGGEIDHMIRERDRTFSRLVRLGYFYIDHANDVYRYTWKGAFLCAWKLTEPIKGLRIKLRERRARALWRKLQMPGTPESPRDSVAATTFGSPLTASQPMPSAAASYSPSNINYEIALAEGEIRQEPSPVGLTVRMGSPTVLRFLLRRAFAIFWIMLLAALLSWCAFNIWRLHLLSARLRLPIRRSWSIFPLLVMTAFLVRDVIKLLADGLVLRGTVVLTASPQGLSYRNTPSLRGSGQIAREDIQGLNVALRQTGLRGKNLHWLYALLENGRRQPLLIAGDAALLEEVRSNLAHAMGIEAIEPPVAPTISS